MKKPNPRICIYAKDIMLLTGKSLSSAKRITAQIRRTYNKPPHSMITIREFACYFGIEEEYVAEALR